MQPDTLTILDYIGNDNRLQEWGRYTCRERSALILQELGLTVHPHVLRKLYIKLGIKFRPVKLEPKCADYHTIHERRQAFALRLGAEIANNTPIVYMDE